MSDRISPNLSRLLRVLVAGGMALAGVAGARAEDKAATAPTEKTDKDKEKDKAEKAKAEKAAKEQEAKKKADEEKKAAQTDAGGGVKGW